MPELPEVEITRRHLDGALIGRRLVAVSVTHERTARFNASTEEVEARLEGKEVVSVGRHGKFLVIALDDGQSVVAHLGMSGRFSVEAETSDTEPHTHFRASLGDGYEVRFIDPRTFGFVSAVDEDELATSGVGRLGPDAWIDPPEPSELAASLLGRTAPIKALLLDQGLISGLGNIYADEALHRAGINPRTPGGDLSLEQVGDLLDAVKDVLTLAIDNGGTTLDDLAYLLPDGRAGENFSSLGVYGRTDEDCRTCGAPIERVVVRARSTHFCPSCQPDMRTQL